jgi:uncharacterized protein (DUF2336 family)
MSVPNTLIAEVEAAIASGSRDKRVDTLRRVTDLFLDSSDRLNDQQIGVFDDVLLHLIKRVESQALKQLGERLAPVDNAPYEVIKQLAHHDDIAVAAPVLSVSARLSDNDLIEIAETKSQRHLWAISGRPQLAAVVTDVLVDRGDREVIHNLAGNAGASFSERGFSTLVGRAEADESLAEKIGLRLDIPWRLLRDLLQKATEAVRSRLLARAPVETRDEIQRVIASISNDVAREATAPRDFAQANDLVQRMQRKNQLNEAAVLAFARAHKYEETVASIALLCSAPLKLIERLMQNVRYDGLLVACKAAELKWPTVCAILTTRFAHHSVATEELQQAKVEFIKLSVATAQRVLRFWLVRETAASKDA